MKSRLLPWLGVLLGLAIALLVGLKANFNEALYQLENLSAVILLPLFLVYSTSWPMRGLSL